MLIISHEEFDKFIKLFNTNGCFDANLIRTAIGKETSDEKIVDDYIEKYGAGPEDLAYGEKPLIKQTLRNMLNGGALVKCSIQDKNILVVDMERFVMYLMCKS